MNVVDLLDPQPLGSIGPADVVVATGDVTHPNAEYWLRQATFTLIDSAHDDRRTVQVASVPIALAELAERMALWPQAAAVCDDVLRSLDVKAPALPGVIAESLAYSTLQAGPEFARWLSERGSAHMPDTPDPVQAHRDGNTLHVRFNRPRRHNAFSTDARAALMDALAVARLDPDVDEVVLGGNGPSFCSGGDLAEFGTLADPASAHLARTRHSPALALDEITARLAGACRAQSTARCWAAVWRWPRSAAAWCADRARCWGCRNCRWA
jgi:Enoyl-CoA hydratase/isomerase